jgi:glycosyltransferase involved in cell wall biosynthesis
VVVSVIIPAYNAEATIARVLDALSRQDFDGDREVILVDDGSTDGTVAIAERAGSAVTVLRQRHLGPAAARNLGVRQAGGELLAFTDADCVPTPAWLREGVRALARADLVQGAVRPDPRTPRYPFDRTVSVTADRGLYECASLFVRREVFERVGGFEDWLGARIGKQLAEDLWFGWRARRAEATTEFCPEALVHHAVLRRGAAGYVAERARRAYFPLIAAKVPELRGSLFYRRYFLTPDSAAFDLAVAGALAAALSRSRLPALAVGPYAWSLARRSTRWRKRAPVVAGVELLADALGLGALAAGSVRARTVVL